MKSVEPLIQYIIVIKSAVKGFNKGAIAANVAHASVACLHRYSTLPYVEEYLKELDSMRKCVLDIEDYEELKPILNTIGSDDVRYYEWVELPEQKVTAVAFTPCLKSEVSHIIGHLKLLR